MRIETNYSVVRNDDGLLIECFNQKSDAIRYIRMVNKALESTTFTHRMILLGGAINGKKIGSGFMVSKYQLANSIPYFKTGSINELFEALGGTPL